MFSIGDAARLSGVSTKMIRYYERIGLVRAAGRTEAGYRTFDDGGVHTLRFVRRARDLGFTLDAIRRLLALWRDRLRSSQDVKRIALDTVDELNGTIAALEGMVRSLKHLAAHCLGDERPDCPIIDELAEAQPQRNRRRPHRGRDGMQAADADFTFPATSLVGRASASRRSRGR